MSFVLVHEHKSGAPSTRRYFAALLPAQFSDVSDQAVSFASQADALAAARRLARRYAVGGFVVRVIDGDAP